MAKEKEIRGSFAVAPQSEKVEPQCINAQLRWKRLYICAIRYFERSRDHIHITFIAVYYYNCSILLLIIVFNLIVCITYKLNFTRGMYP